MVSALLGVTAPREAVAQITWAGTSGDWSTTGAFTNSGGAFTLANNFNQALVFTGASQTTSTNTLTGGTATGITFNAGNFLLGGNAITLNGNIANTITSGTNTITFDMTVPSARTISGNGGTLVLAGAIAGSGSLSFTRVANTPGITLSGSNDFTGGASFATSTALRIANPYALGRSTSSNVLSFGNLTVTNVAGSIVAANNTAFSAGTGSTVNFALAGGNLEFTGTTTLTGAGSGINVSSGTLTLKTLAGTAVGGNGGQLQINGALIIKDASTYSGNWRSSGGTGWVLIGDGAALGTGTYTLNNSTGTQLGTTKDLTISTRIDSLAGGRIGGDYTLTVDQPITGVSGITKVGTGTLALTANNTFAGVLSTGPGIVRLAGSNSMSGVTLNGLSGTVAGVSFENANALGSSGVLTYNGVAGGTAVIRNMSGSPVTLASTGAFTTNNQGTLAFEGPSALTISAGTWTFQVPTVNVVSSTLTMAGSGTGAAIWTKTGGGTLRLSGSNSFTGAMQVGEGVVLLDNAFAVPGGTGVKGSGAPIRFFGGSGGVLGLTSGTFALAVNRTAGLGGVSFTNASGDSGSGGGFAGFASGSTVYVALTVGGTTGGTLQFGSTQDFLASGTNLILGASNATGTVDFQNPLNLNNAQQFIRANDGAAAVDGILSGIVSNGQLTKTGLGTLALTANNTFGGVLTVSQGAVEVASVNNASANGPLGNSANAVVLGSAGNMGALSYTGGSASSSKAFTAATGGTAGFVVNNAATTLTLSGAIDGSGDILFSGPGSVVLSGGLSASSLFKTGAGALTLSVGNSQADTTVSEGQLNVNHLAALGTPAGTLTMAAGTRLDNTSGAAVAVTNPKSIIFGSNFAFLGSDDLDLGTGTVTLGGDTTIDIAAKELTLSGDVLGAGYGITKTGTGTLSLDGLSGTRSFTGNSFVNAGTLLLEGSSILGGGSSTVVTVADGAFLQIGASAGLGNVTVMSRPGGVITASVVNANQTFDQSGALTTSNANFNGIQTIESGVTITTGHNYLGTVPTTATPGRIVFQDNATLRATAGFEINANQGISLASGTAILESDANQAILIPAVLAGTGGIRKIGAGNVRLTGNNTYSGGTVIEQGIVGISYGESLGDVSGRLKLDGGTIVGAQTISGSTISAVTVDSARQFVIANGKTSGIDAQTNLSLRYDGVITEENGGGAAASLRFGSSVARNGTVILGGANTYRGDTTIAFGTLKLASGGSFANSSRIIVGGSGSSGVTLDLTDKTSFSIGSSQTLQGIGTAVLGPTTALDVTGLFSPGNSPGLFTYSGGSTTLSGTTLLEIWGTTRSTGYDAVDVTNNALLNLGGELILDFNQNFADTDSFLLFDTLTDGALAGGFSGITITGSNNDYAALSFVQSGNVWTTGFNGNNQSLRLTQTASAVTLNVIIVPEPDTIIFAGIGITLAGWTVWKRRRIAQITARTK